MASDPAVADVESAILAMYGRGVNSHRQHQALAWLLSFAETDAAWSIFHALLQSSDPSVQYYAANGLYAKVCMSWTSLPEPRRREIYAATWTAVASPLADRLIVQALRKLCLALGAAAVRWRAAGAVADCVHRSAALASDAARAVPPTPARLLAAVELIRGLAEEADRRPGIGFDAPASAQRELREAAPTVLALLNQLLTSDADSPFSLARAMAATRGGSDALASSGHVAVAGATTTLACLEHWAALAAAPGIGTLYLTHPSLVPAAALTLLGCTAAALNAGLPLGPAHALAASAGDALVALLASKGATREPGRDEALAAVTHAIVRDTPHLLTTAAAATAALHPISLVASCIVSVEDEWVAGRGSSISPACPFAAQSRPFIARAADRGWRPANADEWPSIGGEPCGLGVALVDLLLQLSSAHDVATATAPLDAFAFIQALPTDSRHPFLRRPAFRSLLLVIVEHVVYRGDVTQPSDDFLTYRSSRSSLMDALADCCGQLTSGELVTSLVEWAHAGDDVGAAMSPLRLEAALHCMCAVSDEVSDALEYDRDADDTDDDRVESMQRCHSGDGSLEETIVSLVLSVTTTPLPPCAELIVTGCRWLGGLHRWLGSLVSTRTLRTSGGRYTSPGIDASFTLVSAPAFLSKILAFLMQCLSHSQTHGRLGHPPPLDDATAIATVVGTAAAAAGRRPPPVVTPRDAGDDDDDDDQGSGGGIGAQQYADEDSFSGRVSIGAAAASALMHICRACRHVLAVDDFARTLIDAVAAACTAGSNGGHSLPIVAAGDAMSAALTIVSALLSPVSRASATRYILEPVMRRLVGAVTALQQQKHTFNSGSGSSGKMATIALSLTRECALLAVALRSPITEAPASEIADPPPMDVIAAWAWPVLEEALALVHDDEVSVSVVLRLLELLLRSCPTPSRPRASPVLTALMLLYAAHPTYADVLAVMRQAVDALPACGNGSESTGGAGRTSTGGLERRLFDDDSAAQTVAAPNDSEERDRARCTCVSLMASVASQTLATVSASDGGGGCMADILREYFRLADTVLDACAEAVLAPRVAVASLGLVSRAIALRDRDLARPAADFLVLLLAKAEGANDNGVSLNALCSAGAPFVSQLVALLLADDAQAVLQSTIACLHAMMATYGKNGIDSAVHGAMDACIAATTAKDPCFNISSELVCETGIEALGATIRRAVVAQARSLIAQPRRFRMLLQDVSSIARRQATTDVLLSHGLARA